MTEVRDQKSDSRRRRLPDRRPAETVKLAHEGQTVHATAGFCPTTGAVREVFLRRGGPPGSELDRLLDDVGVLLSHLLQLGVTPADLVRGVGRLGAYPAIGDSPRELPRNPAQAFVEVLTNPEYGFAFDTSEIDQVTEAACALYCAELTAAPAASIVGVVVDWLARLPYRPPTDDLDDIKIGGTD